MSLPSSMIAPEEIGYCPTMARSSEVLPTPLRPSTQVTLPGSAEIETRTVECLLPTDQAVPLALLLNELLTAVRPPAGRQKQRITVVVDRPEAGLLSLTVGSDGGLPAQAQRLAASALIDGFVAQLHGRITESRDESGGGIIRVLFANACL